MTTTFAEFIRSGSVNFTYLSAGGMLDILPQVTAIFQYQVKTAVTILINSLVIPNEILNSIPTKINIVKKDNLKTVEIKETYFSIDMNTEYGDFKIDKAAIGKNIGVNILNAAAGFPFDKYVFPVITIQIQNNYNLPIDYSKYNHKEFNKVFGSATFCNYKQANTFLRRLTTPAALTQ